MAQTTMNRITSENVSRIIDSLEAPGKAINYLIVWDLYRNSYKGKDIPSSSISEVEAKFIEDVRRSAAIENI